MSSNTSTSLIILLRKFVFSFLVFWKINFLCLGRYFIASVLLWKLKQRVLLFPKRWEDLKFGRFLTSGALPTLITRNLHFCLAYGRLRSIVFDLLASYFVVE